MASGFSTRFSAALDAAGSLSRPQPANGIKSAGAARDFEALLLGQILKSSHGDGGWLSTDDDDAGAAAVSFSEEQLAQSMASSGGLGLAKLIRSGIDNRQDAIDSAATAAKP